MPLDGQQKANLEADAEALNSELCAAWRTFYLMKGLHIGVNQYPEALEICGGAFSEIWRAQFWKLVANTGTLLDKTRNTQSLPKLLVKIRSYFGKGSDLAELADDLQRRLEDPEATFHRIQEWRHRVVAHNDRNGRGVFDNYAMNPDEVEAMLDELSQLLDEAIWNSIAVHYYMQKEVSQEYEEHGRSLVERIAT